MSARCLLCRVLLLPSLLCRLEASHGVQSTLQGPPSGHVCVLFGLLCRSPRWVTLWMAVPAVPQLCPLGAMTHRRLCVLLFKHLPASWHSRLCRFSSVPATDPALLQEAPVPSMAPLSSPRQEPQGAEGGHQGPGTWSC